MSVDELLLLYFLLLMDARVFSLEMRTISLTSSENVWISCLSTWPHVQRQEAEVPTRHWYVKPAGGMLDNNLCSACDIE